jgi:cytoskeletal protein RodZ
MNKKRIVTILIVIATIALAGVAVFTAIRLYQLRQESVAPTAPTSEPEAAAPVGCTALTFTLTTPSPTGSPTATPTESPTPSESPTATPTESPTATPTATATATSSPITEPELPDAGVSYPTIIGGAAGILLILISLALAL